MKISYRSLICTSFSLLFFCCSQNTDRPSPQEYTDPLAIVEYSAGDDFIVDNEVKDLGYPSNFGRYQGISSSKVKAIILGQKRKRRSKVRALPVAVYTIQSDTSVVHYIVGKEIDYKSDGYTDFSSFITEHGNSKNILEYWLLENCTHGNKAYGTWNNEQYARKLFAQYAVRKDPS